MREEDLPSFSFPAKGYDAHRAEARAYFQRAYHLQMAGQFEEAIVCYTKSLELHPTAEAHTFLGWTYSFQSRYDEAIKECKKAIEVDPEFGNPYNDIGAYLIEFGQAKEAIPWLQKATVAKRYEARCFPHFNLGRVYEHLGQWREAMAAYEQALRISPDYLLALRALNRLKGLFS